MLTCSHIIEIYTNLTEKLIHFMTLDNLDINVAMDLIKEDIIKELSESVTKEISDDISEEITYET